MERKIHVYVDGSGHPRGGFGWFVKETGASHYEKRDNITNNQAEYMAIISALQHVLPLMLSQDGQYADADVMMLSDSLNTVRQLNHEYAINNAVLRELAIKAWSEIARLEGDGADGQSRGSLEISWVRRAENLAGKMLGS